jgi:hypothetical protein
MKNTTKKQLIILLIISVLIFVLITVFTKLFKLADLPLQTIGVLFGAVITAVITYVLLSGQSQAEEVKERNVRVFEEKSVRFNLFIDKLWDIWDDRVVSLEELNELIKLVSKDIILYTKPETVNIILEKLISIAEQANPNKSDIKNVESTKIIQQNIFDIINELAKEIGLGGEIQPEIRKKLNILEAKVVPFLIQKDFKVTYLENFKNTINQSEDVEFFDIKLERNFIWCRVQEDSNVYFRLGPVERNNDQHAHLTIYVEYYSNRKFQNYRDAVKGTRKDYLRGSIRNITTQLINFNDFNAVEKMFYEIKQDEQKENQSAKAVIELYKTWKIDNKNIEELIIECSK